MTARGQEFLRQQREALGSSHGPRSGYRFQANFDGGRVQFFFLSDGDDVHVALAHMVEIKTKWGDRPFERLCGKETADEPDEVCPRCSDPQDESGDPWAKPVYYIFVEKIYHPTQKDMNGQLQPDWAAVNLGTLGIFYAEEINEVRLLGGRRSWKIDSQIEEAFAGDPTNPEAGPGTLLTHRYQWVVAGERQKRIDNLITGDQVFEEQPASVAEARATLPPLAETVQKEWADKASGKFAPGGVVVEHATVQADAPPVEDPMGADSAAATASAVEPVDF